MEPYIWMGLVVLVLGLVVGVPLALWERRQDSFRVRAEKAFREAYERAHKYDDGRQT